MNLKLLVNLMVSPETIRKSKSVRIGIARETVKANN